MIQAFQILVLTALAGVLSVSGQEYYYCANVNVATAAGGISTSSTGYFSMKIGEGYSKYGFSVDLSAVPTSVCDFSAYPAVSYHIHTNSVATTCTDANGHYDPNLACSEKSQAHASSCTQLARTSADGYVYTCTAAAGTVTYSTPTGSCEVGDLSGKLGKVTLPTSKVAASSEIYTDYVPPYNYNYNQATEGITSGWASIVFHCGDTAGTRIACGNFQLTTQDTSTACSFDASAWVQNESCGSDDDDDVSVSAAGFDALLAFFVIGWVLVVVLLVWGCFCRGAKAADQTPMVNSSRA